MTRTCTYDWVAGPNADARTTDPVLRCVEHGGRDLSGRVYNNDDPHNLTGGPCDSSPPETPQETAERWGWSLAQVSLHLVRHTCVDGRQYNGGAGSCLVTDPSMHDVTASRLARAQRRGRGD